MVYAAWSSTPFGVADFVRGDHWDYGVFDQYNASEDPESQLTDVVLLMTSKGFDYAIDRYIVYTQSEAMASDYPTYIGVSGWPWPTYYSSGWSIGLSFGLPCCYNNWYGWYPWYGYGWGYPGYGWGYPGYGWGYPGYGYGYPIYGGGYYPAGGYYPGYGYHPAYGGRYPGYRPYTFKPGGTLTNPGNPYRPRSDVFAPANTGLPTTDYRGRSAAPAVTTPLGRSAVDAATISGHAEAGRRPAARPAPQVESSRPQTGGAGAPSGGASPGTGRRSTGGPRREPPAAHRVPVGGPPPRVPGPSRARRVIPAGHTAGHPTVRRSPPSRTGPGRPVPPIREYKERPAEYGVPMDDALALSADRHRAGVRTAASRQDGVLVAPRLLVAVEVVTPAAAPPRRAAVGGTPVAVAPVAVPVAAEAPRGVEAEVAGAASPEAPEHSLRGLCTSVSCGRGCRIPILQRLTEGDQCRPRFCSPWR
jgi:hypothetical protein